MSQSVATTGTAGVGLEPFNAVGTLRIPVTAVTAAGSVVGDGAALSEGMNVVASADGTKGVVLPVAVPGMVVKVKNNTSGQTLKVYAQASSTINAVSANSAFSMASVTSCEFVAVNTTGWMSFPLVAS